MMNIIYCRQTIAQMIRCKHDVLFITSLFIESVSMLNIHWMDTSFDEHSTQVKIHSIVSVGECSTGEAFETLQTDICGEKRW